MWCLRLAYDGTDFHGAAELVGVRTVAGEVRAALRRVGVVAACVEPLSRTDAGVHAQGALLVLDGLPDRPATAWLMALERHLPTDARPIALARLEAAPQVKAKTYRYTLDTSAMGDVRLARWAWRAQVPFQALQHLACRVVGEHDLRAFRRRGETREAMVRRIDRCEWSAQDHVLSCEITGSGFPYRGVRALVGAMVHTAQGHASEERFQAALCGKHDPLAQQSVPARGLCLERIELDNEPDWCTRP